MRSPSRARCLGTAALALIPCLLASGCAAVLAVNGGGDVALDTRTTPDTPTVSPEALLGAQIDVAIQGFGLGVAAHSRAGPRGFETGAGPELCWLPAIGDVNPYICGGMQLLSLGLRDRDFSLGAFSPYLHPEVAIALGDDTPNSIFVGAIAGYDVRFTGQPSSLWVGLTFGVGWSMNSERVKESTRSRGKRRR